jgi:hypothetical protein
MIRDIFIVHGVYEATNKTVRQHLQSPPKTMPILSRKHEQKSVEQSRVDRAQVEEQ